jgi:hypothetical protein
MSSRTGCGIQQILCRFVSLPNNSLSSHIFAVRRLACAFVAEACFSLVMPGIKPPPDKACSALDGTTKMLLKGLG